VSALANSRTVGGSSARKCAKKMPSVQSGAAKPLDARNVSGTAHAFGCGSGSPGAPSVEGALSLGSLGPWWVQDGEGSGGGRNVLVRQLRAFTATGSVSDSSIRLITAKQATMCFDPNQGGLCSQREETPVAARVCGTKPPRHPRLEMPATAIWRLRERASP
jgi:hypothetical protein